MANMRLEFPTVDVKNMDRAELIAVIRDLEQQRSVWVKRIEIGAQREAAINKYFITLSETLLEGLRELNEELVGLMTELDQQFTSYREVLDKIAEI